MVPFNGKLLGFVSCVFRRYFWTIFSGAVICAPSRGSRVLVAIFADFDMNPESQPMRIFHISLSPMSRTRRWSSSAAKATGVKIESKIHRCGVLL